jgi:hypothetical protein
MIDMKVICYHFRGRGGFLSESESGSLFPRFPREGWPYICMLRFLFWDFVNTNDRPKVKEGMFFERTFRCERCLL